jgi:hypothetical protein
MAAERDFELLDDYLGNRMDEQSRAAFEQKINADQELKAEFDLQQQTISSIKKARVAELKGMLNNIPVPAGQTTGVAVGAKVTLWVAVAGLLATGIYLYIDKPAEEISVPSTEVASDSDTTENLEEKAEETEPVGKAHEDSPVVSSQKSSAEQKPIAPPKPGSKATQLRQKLMSTILQKNWKKTTRTRLTMNWIKAMQASHLRSLLRSM